MWISLEIKPTEFICIYLEFGSHFLGSFFPAAKDNLTTKYSNVPSAVKI